MPKSAAELPDVFVNERQDQFTDPVYRLHADGYYGESHWYEGDIIVWLETPNQTMEPLNRAAGLAMEAWLESLPLAGANSVHLTISDLLEAARLIPEDQVKSLDQNAYGKAIATIAIKLKEKRDGKPGMLIPGWGSVRTAAASSAPPMRNAAIQNVRHNGPMGMGEPGPQRAAKPSSARTTKGMTNTPEPSAVTS